MRKRVDIGDLWRDRQTHTLLLVVSADDARVSVRVYQPGVTIGVGVIVTLPWRSFASRYMERLS